MSVLIDTSVWIAASSPKNKECLTVKRMIMEKYPICYAEPIQMEVAQGAKSPQQFRKIWDSFLGFELLVLQPGFWEKASWNFFRCRKQGVTLSSMDAVVATISLEQRV